MQSHKETDTAGISKNITAFPTSDLELVAIPPSHISSAAHRQREQTASQSIRGTNGDKEIEVEKWELLPYNSVTTAEKLLHKISQLEVQLQEPTGVSLSEHHRNRILGKVIECELRRFLKEGYQQVFCQRCLSKLSSVAPDNDRPSQKRFRGEENSEAIGKGDEPEITRELSRSLDMLRKEKNELEEQIRGLQEKTIVPLENEVDALRKDKQQMQEDFSRLQEENRILLEKTKEISSCNDSNPIEVYSSSIAELHQLRETEVLLRAQLQEMQHSALTTTTNMLTLMKDDEETVFTRVSELQDSLLFHKEKLREAELSRSMTLLLLEEEKERHCREVEMLSAQRQHWGAYYLQALQVWEDRYSEAKIWVAKREEKNKQLQEELRKLQENIERIEHDETVHHGKRRRLDGHECDNDKEMVSQSKPLRLKYLNFWEDGHLRIADQERQIKALENRCATLRVNEKKVRQLQRQQDFRKQQLVTLASTVKQLREEVRSLKSELAGVRVERDCLIDTMGRAFTRDNAELMSREEVEKCASEIRQAAKAAAAASASVVADPKAMEDSARRARVCKTEVERLEKQKEKLLRFIQLRQGRISALLAREAVSALGTSLSPSLQESLKKSDTFASSCVPLAQILEHARECARDIFNDCEKSVLGPGQVTLQNSSSSSSCPSLPHSQEIYSHLSRRQQLDALLQERVTIQASCESLKQERSHLIGAIQQKKDELTQNTLTSEKVINALQRSNRELSDQLAQFRAQVSSLNQRNIDMKKFVCISMQGMGCIFDLLKAEISSSADLRRMITTERNHLRNTILRFEGVGSNEESSVGTQYFQQQKNDVAKAISSLGAQIQEAVNFLRIECSSHRTSFLLDLVKALRAQEDRITQLQQIYEEKILQLAHQLVKRVEASQRQWDSSWQEKYETVEALQRHFLIQEKSYSAVLQKLEEACPTPLPPTTVVPTSPNNAFTSEGVDEVIRAIQSYMEQLPSPEKKVITLHSIEKTHVETSGPLQPAESNSNVVLGTTSQDPDNF